ncbi:hypothetical protein JM16_004884 [Phytophthora kernoviae]|uniref:F5/8 type C domain-containing protein n=1 Tax=Phytophthora kernoviae TaxID=325452 RepID=A0A8T0LZI0_9STRA|nr:hypothetical protein JM16_004884 [Phytophthora kernoviae]
MPLKIFHRHVQTALTLLLVTVPVQSGVNFPGVEFNAAIGEPAHASSYYNYPPNPLHDTVFVPGNANDGFADETSWWSAGDNASEQVFWQVNMSALAPKLSRIVVRWHGFMSPRSYRIRVSYDGVYFTSIIAVANLTSSYDRVDNHTQGLSTLTSKFKFMRVAINESNVCGDAYSCVDDGISTTASATNERVLYGIREVEVWAKGSRNGVVTSFHVLRYPAGELLAVLLAVLEVLAVVLPLYDAPAAEGENVSTESDPEPSAFEDSVEVVADDSVEVAADDSVEVVPPVVAEPPVEVAADESTLSLPALENSWLQEAESVTPPTALPSVVSLPAFENSWLHEAESVAVSLLPATEYSLEQSEPATEYSLEQSDPAMSYSLEQSEPATSYPSEQSSSEEDSTPVLVPVELLVVVVSVGVSVVELLVVGLDQDPPVPVLGVPPLEVPGVVVSVEEPVVVSVDGVVVSVDGVVVSVDGVVVSVDGVEVSVEEPVVVSVDGVVVSVDGVEVSVDGVEVSVDGVVVSVDGVVVSVDGVEVSVDGVEVSVDGVEVSVDGVVVSVDGVVVSVEEPVVVVSVELPVVVVQSSEPATEYSWLQSSEPATEYSWLQSSEPATEYSWLQSSLPVAGVSAAPLPAFENS